MAMFHFHTALMHEAIAFAAGLALLHFGRANAAILLRAAGAVLIVASLASAACTIYYGIRYHVQGEFEHAYAGAAGCGIQHEMMLGHAGMGGTHGMGGMHGMPRMGGGRGMMGDPPRGEGDPPAAQPPAGGPKIPGSDEQEERRPAQ